MKRLIVAGACCLFLLACGGDDDVATPLPDVSLATLNILHGIFCAQETEDCRIEDRVDLFFDWVEDTGCPDILTMQEVLGDRVADLVRDRVTRRCPFTYQVLEPPGSQNFTLSRYPALETNEALLHGIIPRLVWHTRIDHPTGTVDVFNTHLAAGVDGGPLACAENCPPECVNAGALTNRDCQAVQVANFADLRSAPGSLRILAGDFNATPDTFVYRHLTEERQWQDTYLEAGLPECDADTGIGCTSGREDNDLSDMESPANGVRRRIDYLFVQTTPAMPGRDYRIDSAQDDDGDGLPTRIFTDDPNPFAPSCGPLPDPICWPSDHEGMQVDLNCHGDCGS